MAGERLVEQARTYMSIYEQFYNNMIWDYYDGPNKKIVIQSAPYCRMCMWNLINKLLLDNWPVGLDP